MKVDMLSFVLQNQGTGVLQNRITGSSLKQPIISGADQFRRDQKLDLEFESEKMTNQAKQSVGPMSPDRFTAESVDQTLEQASMFSFFGDEEFQSFVIGEFARDLGPRLFNQKFAFAGLTQLKVRQGPGQNALHLLRSSGLGRFHFGSGRLVRLF